ncbi:hypothetical protein [Actinacidiphila sp. ITFR-21]|uniref:hypothetical protein n=1 Tax=Actinacidiphila sp. ITFR-21 TaxID=3075199 RepID=UPI002889DC8E|nr:hypothetical protein [Streptomyces sp. ITFR-21]WNI15561.1 hypothetical protein RLT57_08495 [Streptomyces sp. ITFR-21]
MTDTTTARRALLALLLDRADRGALLPAEMLLLRPLIAAEQESADARGTAAHGANEEAWDWHDRASTAEGTIARVADALNSLGPLARFHIATALGATETAAAARREAIAGPSGGRHYRSTDGEDMHAAYMDGQAALARVRVLANGLESFAGGAHPDDEISRGLAAQWILTALDGPSPTDDATEPTPRYGGPLCHDTDPTTLKECALDHEHTGDHADANITWPRQPDNDTQPYDDDGRPTCRVIETRTCPDSYDGQPCGDRPCARFESDDPTPWVPEGTPAAVIEALRTGQPVTLTRCSPL